ncbi:phosphoribosylglycinamide formyltransferase [Mesonia maritima]|uniref:Phosphoribosylglycinamide formyltransferase n=1 Tax=Mesonia maritima TaxID=1793873 RepID=A0ABU1K2P0_9FLAO|nr:phosphoribosylglycinamide formyltransferase [Mesonia maritima]MDR6299873.1 phosphoribosylglycinamide formyltransferase-1 [Mesonia maritima]
MKAQQTPSQKNIVIFASGEGTNAKNIIQYFSKQNNIKVTHVLSNNIRAKVLKTAHDLEINALHFDRAALYHTNEVFHLLQDINPDLIVLAGFLWILPEKIIEEFPNKIINIHPALLPKYGGKGMYGNNVHKAVLENNETETGISIHYVNEKYDEGELIEQFSVKIEPSDDLDSVKKKIKTLEHKHFPEVIEKLLTDKE